MTVRDMIIYIAGSKDIETELGELEPQEALLKVGDEFYPLGSIWVRGDNKLILDIEVPPKEGGDAE